MIAEAEARKPRGLSPTWILFFLSPMIAELLTGSSPPAEFFRPAAFVLMAVLYGSGAILCRELTIRWRKSWPTLLCLGGAYGIIEEGLMVKSFFDPNWVDLGPLGSYGRWAGVNWVWAVELTIFHAVFSIGIPILLVSLIVPSRASEPWARPRWLVLLTCLLLADVALGYFALTPFRPALGHSAAAAGLAAALVLLGRRLPAGSHTYHEDRPMPRDRWFALVGFAATALFFLISWVLPATGLPPVLTVAVVVTLLIGTLGLLCRMARATSGLPGPSLALATGALAFFIALAPLQQMDSSRRDNTSGMALVGLAAALFLVWLNWRRRKTSAPIDASPRDRLTIGEA